MRCPKCGADIDNNSTTCPKCGTPIIKIKPMRVCTNCGCDVPDDADKCPGCGRTIKRRAHQTMGSSFTGESDIQSRTGSQEESLFKKTIKKDRYAWMQSIVPGVLALVYHWLVLRDNMGYNLVNTVIIFEALVFYYGYKDIKDLNKRPEMMGGLVFSEKFIYLTYFLPILSLWERRQLPGMDRKAIYPILHTVLFTLLILSIIIGMDIYMLQSM